MNLSTATKSRGERMGGKTAAGVGRGLTGILGLALLAACGGENGGQAGRGAGGGGALAMGGAADRAVPVAVEVAGPSDLQLTLRGSANLRARQRVEILPKQGGVVARMLVEEGAAVRQGQPLALLDDAEWRLQARQSAARAQAARDAFQRGLALQERDLLADQEVERLRSDAEVAAADAALAELRVENATIVSPLSGVVTHRHIEQGQMVGTNTIAFTVADLSRLEADVGVPEREASRVQVGQPARFRFEGGGSGVVGRVARIRPVVDPTSGTVQVTVEVDPQQAVALRAGQFVNVDIVTQVLQSRLAVPRTALLIDGPVPRLYRVVDGRAEEVQVTIGTSHGERVEIVSGIAAGDTVVVVGQDNLRPGAAVLVMEVNGTAVASSASPAPVLARQEGIDPEALDAGLAGEGADAPRRAAAAGGPPNPGAGRVSSGGAAPPQGSGARSGGGP